MTHLARKKEFKGKSSATVIFSITVAENGKDRSLTTIDLDTLPGWLFSIDERNVNPEVREKLVRYQKEAARGHSMPASRRLIAQIRERWLPVTADDW